MSWEIGTTIVGGISTLAVFSILVRENGCYRFFEHLFIGISTGIGLMVVVRDMIYPMVLVPLLGLDLVTYPDGTVSAPYDLQNLLFIPPMLLGLCIYFIYSPRYAWLAKMVIGIMLGTAGGMMFEGFFSEMLPQIFSSFKPLVVFTESREIAWGQSISNCIFVVTLVSVLWYFFFSLRPREGVLGRSSVAVSSVGRWLMMICFGAFFGSTVMARMALLVERLQFLYGPWWSALATLVKG